MSEERHTLYDPAYDSSVHWEPTAEQVQELIRAARIRHMSGGLAGHSPGCMPDLVKRTCRCGAIRLYLAIRDITRGPDYPCVQTENVYGLPLPTPCAEIRTVGKHVPANDTRKHVDDLPASACVHHVPLPADMLAPLVDELREQPPK